MSQELYHHGIQGQKWGVRRYQNPDGSLTPAGKKRYNVNEARNDYKEARRNAKEVYRNSKKFGFGIKGIAEVNKGLANQRNANLNVLDKKAALNAAKSKNSEKAEFDTYRKAMQKTGLRGSSADVMSNYKSTELYNHIQTTKGKEYADRVEKKVQSTAVKQLVGSAAVMAGSLAIEYYLYKKNS